MIVHLFDRAFKLMRKAPVEGCFVEFGVFRGDSLRDTAKMTQKYLEITPDIYGFDTFNGMPSTKIPLSGKEKEGWKTGTFADTSIERVDQMLKKANVKAKLIKSEFKDLPPLKKLGITKIRFAYLDADIYEGYRDALMLITPYLQIGTVIVFDEYTPPSDHRHNKSVRDHGMKAIREWEEKTGINLHIIRFRWSTTLCVIVDEKYLKKYGRFIETLRHDNFIQSAADSFHQLLQRINI